MDNRTLEQVIANEDRLIEEIDKQAKVIQWYEKENRHNQEIIIKDTKEIERLNNIIEDFEEELEREVNVKEEDTGLEHNTYIDINNTLKTVLKRFRELKGSDK